jgi:hypothetical protein
VWYWSPGLIVCIGDNIMHAAVELDLHLPGSLCCVKTEMPYKK